jgi:adenylyl- and sulfurtransferase ThiI
MNSYAIPIEGKNLKKIGNRIILSLSKDGNTSKYRIIGNLIFLECTNKIYGSVEGKKAFDSVISSSDEDDIYNSIRKLVKSKKETQTFAIRVIRKGNHRYDSTSLARNVAGAAFEEWKKISVNLGNPELEIFVQIINNISIIYLKYS